MLYITIKIWQDLGKKWLDCRGLDDTEIMYRRDDTDTAQTYIAIPIRKKCIPPIGYRYRYRKMKNTILRVMLVIRSANGSQKNFFQNSHPIDMRGVNWVINSHSF